MRNRVFEQYTTDDAGLRVELLVQPAINYALVHNRVPLVRRLSISNNTDDPVTDLEIRLELIGPDGSLTEPWRQTVGAAIRPGSTIGWEDFTDFSPSMAQLRAADEAFRVDYQLTVTRADGTEIRLGAPSSVLAHNEWFNSPALYDSLAAFVQPNTKTVETVLRSAAQILLAHTGSGSLQGYQAGPERAARIAGAIYEALRQMGIHYQGLPASFENTGQKIRTTAAVLDGRLGNCIDISVTYAACLEAAGLHPLIWITSDHAFAGFLVEDERLGSAALTEANLMISMVESGKAVPVELTKIGPGAQCADFTAAVQLGLAHFRTSGHELQGVVDVSLAHRSGIRPLPSTDVVEAPPEVGTHDGTPGVGSIDLPSGVARTRLRERAEAGDEAPQQPDDSPLRVQQWKKSLLDLSLRNPLLNLPKRGRGLDLHVPAGSLALLDDLIHEGKQLEIVPQDAISHVHELAGARRAQDLEPEILTRELRVDRRIYGTVTEARYKAAMRALQRDARTMQQETGSNYLYLTIGTLVHMKGTGTEAHAPLFLLPVRIEGGTGRRPYFVVVDGPEIASPNYCLIEWLRVKHGVQIPELENPARDEHGIDISKTLADINASLVEHRLNYRIDETASLRLLQFSTFQMWRDLTDQWSTFMKNPVVKHLVESGGAVFDDPAGDDTQPAIDEANMHLPIPADGSQMQAIVMAERGYSFVLEGPPGTGKSQTITNLIARALNAGRTVLFVAEKQAALDVVKRRLKQVGLAPFALDLHGRKQSVNAIREQLRDALEQQETDDSAGWAAVETSYRTRLAPLTSYPQRVHAANNAGLSAWSAYEAVRAYGEGPTAVIPATYLAAPEERQRQVDQALREFPAAAHSARLRPDHPWSLSGRRTVDGLRLEAVTQIATDLEAVRVDLLAHPDLTSLVRDLPGPEAVAGLLPAARLAVLGVLPDRATTTRAFDQRWNQAIGQLTAALTNLRQGAAAELARFRPEIFTLPELSAWRTDAEQAAKRMFGKTKHLQIVADRLTPHVRSGDAVGPNEVQHVIGRLLAIRAEAAALLQQIRAVGGVRLPHGWLPTNEAAEAQFADAVRASIISRELLGDRPAFWAHCERGLDERQFSILDRLASAWQAWCDLLQSGPGELRLWCGDSGWFDTWQRDGQTWLTDLRASALLSLQRWGAVLGYLDALAGAGLAEYWDQLLRGQIDPDAGEEAYRRGVASTALAERLRAGELDYFDPELHDNHIAQFEEVSRQLREALPVHLPAVLVRRRPFNPAERRGRFADFAAELRRKRGGKSFRELFSAYPDVVLALTPCVLVSPASAATFLAPDAARFDLVIFDEASQIRVAEAIGAMGRGKSVIVVGDSKQMPPTNIMQASHAVDEGGEDEGPVPEDLESILSEAVESGLPQRWLSWHYRSQDESLIAFSNRYYYDNKLSTLPSPGVERAAGVTWRRVDGRFDRGASRTNEVEAKAVVAEITRLLHASVTATPSIGVVTFNIQQRDLILNLLEDSTDPVIRAQLSEAAAEPIFVKNLENVQGDERDVILFSLAFSPNPENGHMPLNFGPLSQVGGERRLNVAISRARRQVILFASFDPGDIDLARTTAVGTAHLRAYCEMAAAGVDQLGDLAASRQQRRDRIRDEVAEAIRERGHEVTTGHGLSNFTVDIAVRAPGAAGWQVAVMLDGPEWSRRPTVADRDGAPVLLRTIMGWPEMLRFWLPAWIRDRSHLLDRVDAAVARAVANEQTATAEAPQDLPTNPTVSIPAQQVPTGPAAQRVADCGDDTVTSRPELAQSVAVVNSSGEASAAVLGVAGRMPDAEPVSFVPYVPTRIGTQSDIDVIRSDSRVRSLVQQTLREVIAAEGPIEQHRLARLTLARFGFGRTREDRRAAVLALVDPGVIRQHPVGGFAWPSDLDPVAWRGFRTTQTSTDRDFDEIAPEEVANAIGYALGRASKMTEEQLLRAGLELLGYRRKTEKIDRLLRYGLEIAYQRGQVSLLGSGEYSVMPTGPNGI
jgi:hypothetical protein